MRINPRGLKKSIVFGLAVVNRQFLVRPTSFLKPVKKEVGRFMTARYG